MSEFDRAANLHINRWSKAEHHVLERGWGVDPPSLLQRKLRPRSWEAIRHEANRQGLSFYNNGGGLTAAEVARRTGINVATLKQWLWNKQLPGAKKVGRRWFIPEEMLTDLKPAWVGTQAHLSDPDFLNRPEKSICYCCGNTIEGNFEWCSRQCFQDYKHHKSEELATGEPNLLKIFPSYLLPSTQDVLKSLGQIIRLPQVPEHYTFPFNKKYVPSNKDRHLRWVMSINQGYVVDAQTAANFLTPDARIYGLATDKTTGKVVIDPEDLSRVTLNLAKPDSISITNDELFGIGVYSNLEKSELVLFRQLYQKTGCYVSLDYLENNISRFFKPGQTVDIEKIALSLVKKINNPNIKLENRERIPNKTDRNFIRLAIPRVG